MQATDFTRERVLTWPVVLILMLRGQKVSLQTVVNKFFSAVGEVWPFRGRVFKQLDASRKFLSVSYLYYSAATARARSGRVGGDGD